MKRLGLLPDGNAFELYQAAPAVMKMYGETAVGWNLPKKRLMNAGIYNTIEMDRALGTTDFTIFDGISWMITRKAYDGKIYAPDQAVDRQQALKISTYHGAYFLMRENVLGSLEPAKWADFAVLDRDYLTIPQDEIADVRVLMTATGGKIFHLVPSVAREIGLQPTGSQVTLGGPAAQW
jgi:predicted amidohydrolase YtcJ